MGLFSFIKKKWNDWYYHDMDDDDDDDDWYEPDLSSFDGSDKDGKKSKSDKFFRDADSRTVFVLETLERMAEAAEKAEETKAEFDAVTSLLIDMEEIENLPSDVMVGIMDTAMKIENLEKQRRILFKDTNVIPEDRLLLIERLEDEIPDGIRKMKEAEKYRRLIKHDLKKLEAERASNRFRKRELRSVIGNSRGIAMICGFAMLLCFVILMFLHFSYGMNVSLGYLVAGGAGAITLTYIYIRYIEANQELKLLSKTINKLITLHNTVKIRYINNTNLLSYLYMKYDVEDSSDLEEIWQEYLDEVQARKKDERIRSDLEYLYDKLTSVLMHNNIKDPDIWTHQAIALYDQRERVEVRHALIARRQKLREQMEYNEELAKNEQMKIKVLARQYPQYSQEIAHMVNNFQGL